MRQLRKTIENSKSEALRVLHASRSVNEFPNPQIAPSSSIRCKYTNSRYTLYIPRNISLA